MAEFARGFRLTMPDGETYDGAQFPSGRGIVLDHPERGFATVATDMDHLLESFPDARIEWADEPLG